MAAASGKHAPFQVRVACHAGYRGEETPRRFAVGQEWIRVEQILDRWVGPDHRYFKLLGDDEGVYILRHDETGDRWELTMYESASLGLLLPGSEPRQ